MLHWQLGLSARHPHGSPRRLDLYVLGFFLPVLCGIALSMAPLLTLAGTNKPAGAKGFRTHVGGQVCARCHPREYQAWTGSHHDLAMQQATGETVLGDFDNHSLTHYGVRSLFFKRDGRFMVRTEGPDGRLGDFEIEYTFGVEPLQQYLVEFPGGRLQALSLAWDTRPKDEGGQRWFHLYPDEKVAAKDELHWTQPSQNWNSMCAECHSTHLEKRYDPATRTFATTWSEIDVSCEACHGPGSQHVAWAEHKPGWESLDVGKGLAVVLDERRDVYWKMDPESGNASRSRARSTDTEIELCARCHARRSPISEADRQGEPFLDHYMPRLLDEGMYFADGQIDGEVYVYGSFLQSRMYQAGVTCSDCHEPHSLRLRAPGNAVCLQCHAPAKYDQTGHHFHHPGSKGGSCTECHMPTRTYMVVDPRHDHSMRIPRPDLSVELGTPNACNNCHQEESSEWAAGKVATWYGRTPTGYQSYGQALHAARNRRPGANAHLAELTADMQAPAIVRATALAQIELDPNESTARALKSGLTDHDAMVRAAAVRSLKPVPAEIRLRLLLPMLTDPVRAVRIEAARLLAGVPDDGLLPDQRVLLESGLREYVQAQRTMAERPEVQTNLGDLYAARGAAEKAAAAYKAATDINPRFVPGYVNLADLYRAQGEEKKAEDVLRRALRAAPGSAAAHHALGLSLVRQKRRAEALEVLRMAWTLDADNARYAYVYALALNSTGSPQEAIALLEGAHQTHPNDRHILSALVAFHRDRGNRTAARAYADRLRNLLR